MGVGQRQQQQPAAVSGTTEKPKCDTEQSLSHQLKKLSWAREKEREREREEGERRKGGKKGKGKGKNKTQKDRREREREKRAT